MANSLCVVNVRHEPLALLDLFPTGKYCCREKFRTFLNFLRCLTAHLVNLFRCLLLLRSQYVFTTIWLKKERYPCLIIFTYCTKWLCLVCASIPMHTEHSVFLATEVQSTSYLENVRLLRFTQRTPNFRTLMCSFEQPPFLLFSWCS